jgi:pyruvate dehydrogenase E2 component (dihydrolipoamide acetyltransferase)
MPFEFRLPDIGEGLTEAEVVEWLVEEGRDVAVDQPLVQIETDKAVTDIPSPREGVLLRQGAPAGAVVRVGEVLAVIGEAGEDEEAAPIVGTLPTGAHRPVAQALPLVRRLAKELGVDLSTVTGTGPGGRISKEDVEAVAAAGRATSPDQERIRLSKLRRTIAANMARSWREIPHVTTFGQADASALLALGRDLDLPLEALFIAAVMPALKAHPEFNASVDGEDLVIKRRYDIGVAVDTADGLVVVVVLHADALAPAQLGREVVRLAEAARSRTATPHELTNQTFTISNIGAVGGGHGTPIIPYGTTAILSFGRAVEQPVVRDGGIVVEPVLPLSLSYDHRVIDGALGRRFLATVVERLERPAP